MKVLVEQAHLADVFGFVRARAVNPLKIPILHNVLIAADKSEMRLMGHDFDSSSEARCPAEVTETGSCTLSAERLGVFLNGVPKGSQILISTSETQVDVRCGRSHYKFPLLPASDYPDMLSVGNDAKTEFVHLTKPLVDALLARPRGGISPKETRIALCGVYLHQAIGGKLAGAATDGVTILRFVGDKQTGESAGIIIPKRSVDELVKLADEDGLLLRWSDRIVEARPARSNKKMFSSKLIDATFPAYENIVPAMNDGQIAVDRIELVRALERLGAVETEDRTAIVIKWDGGEHITASLNSSDGNGEEVINADIPDIEPGQIRANGGYLITALSALQCEVVRLCPNFKGNHSSVRFVDRNDPDAIVMVGLIGDY